MNAVQIGLVRDSWQQVLPLGDAVAGVFYRRLFELDPSVQTLFKGDMVEQGRKLLGMIDRVVAGLDALGPLIADIEALGRRHRDYGVADAHYDLVGDALLWTLGQGLGERFTSAVEAAWRDAYLALSGVMKAAAARPL